MTISTRLVALAVACFCISEPGNSATLPAGFSETLVASGIASPTAMAFAPDGRLFVCEQGGRLRVIKNGTLLSTAFATFSVDPNGERGLLGVAFDPAFTTNNFVYVYYTATSQPRRNRVARLTANGDVAQSGSERLILELNDLSNAQNHNGGAMHFGADGKLYIAVGENANSGNSQIFTTLLGKILRINPDGSIPSDNPFYTTAGGVNRAIWALGLRNPYTFAFEPGTNHMYINDVGENRWEEINDGVAGANYGWPTTEGYTTDSRFKSPLYVYGHGVGSNAGCAITGGAFYKPATNNFPNEYIGSYFFADYCSGWINRYIPSTNTTVTFASGAGFPVDLLVGPEGGLYYASRGSSAIYRIDSTTQQKPSIVSEPSDLTVAAGQPATFSVSANGTTPLRYQWYRNGTAISGATSTTYRINSTAAADNGARFYVVVTNDLGNATSRTAFLTITPNDPPVAIINTPAAGSLYTAGTSLSYSGQGTDPQDGTLPASAFTWQIDFHHDTHSHPFLPARSGVTSGTVPIPNTGEQSANVWYRIYLTVKDSAGLTTTVTRDVFPRKATVSLDTNPRGLNVTYNGQPFPSLFSVQAVVGMIAQIGVPSPQILNGVTYEFVSWSDNGTREHNITVPGSNTTYTARFQPVIIGNPSSPYLSDRTWVSATNGLGPAERNRSNGDLSAGDGRVITLNGVTYSKGIGVHAPSDIRFDLPGDCVAFRADIGVDDEVSFFGSVTFQVLADGVSIFDSGRMAGLTPTRSINLNIAGKRQLALVVTNGGDNVWFDHADWANARISCGTTTYLSDRSWSLVSNGYGPVELDRSNGEQAANDGKTLTIGSKTYTKGLGVHAASDIRYALAGACTTFAAEIGVDEEVGNQGSVAFQVWGDGVKLFDSGVLTGTAAAVPISVDITGRNELQLKVTDGGNGAGYDHADWADAKLTCSPGI